MKSFLIHIGLSRFSHSIMHKKNSATLIWNIASLIDCVPVFMRWCRHLFIQDLFLFFSETFSSCEEKLFRGRDSTCGSTVLMFHPLKIYQIKAEVLHWCRTPPSLLSQSNWAQWAGNLSLIQPYLIVESAHICLLSLLKYYLLCLPPPLV